MLSDTVTRQALIDLFTWTRFSLYRYNPPFRHTIHGEDLSNSERERWRKSINLQSILVNNENKSFPAERRFIQKTISFIIIHENPSSFAILKLQTCQGIEINVYTSNNYRVSYHSFSSYDDMMEILRLQIPRLLLGKQNKNLHKSRDPWIM